jgi:hypothetical protein
MKKLLGKRSGPSGKSGVMKNAGIGAFSVYGIYPEPPISQRNFGMILIRLRAKEIDFAHRL